MSIIIENKKRFFISSVVLAVLIFFVVWGAAAVWKKYKSGGIKEENPLSVYEMLVQMTDEPGADTTEGQKSNFQKGDTRAVFPEGHPWSETEKISYLILKLRLEPEDAEKLTASETKKIKTGEKNPDGEKTETEELEKLRIWRVEIEKLDFDIKAIQTGKGQPFAEKIFDAKMIEKK